MKFELVCRNNFITVENLEFEESSGERDIALSSAHAPRRERSLSRQADIFPLFLSRTNRFFTLAYVDLVMFKM